MRGMLGMLVAGGVLIGAVPAVAGPAEMYTATRDGHEVKVITFDDSPHHLSVDLVRRTIQDRGSDIYGDQPRYYFVLRLREFAGQDLRENIFLDEWKEERRYKQDGVRCDNTHEGYTCNQAPKDRIGLVLRLGAGHDRVNLTAGARRNLMLPEVWGGNGDDTLLVGQWSSVDPAFLLGGGGDDRLIGALRSREALFGGPGNDRIAPGGHRPDYVDGGHGTFDAEGRPVYRSYVNDPAECAARTQGFWDRAHEDPAYQDELGVDTLDLRPGTIGEQTPVGALADLNICRLGFHHSSDDPSLVHAIEIVRGTDHNDRLVGDGAGSTVIGYGGRDWLSGGRDGAVDARDGEVDTVQCYGSGNRNYNWVDSTDKQLFAERGKACMYWKVS